MNAIGKIGIGVGIVGAVAAVATLVVKLVNGNKEKPVAAGATEYCADDEIQKVEGWETSRNEEL